jgi:surface polysaccharide O-acyltransferase-like enzyme
LDGFTPGVALMAIGAYGSVSALYGERDASTMPKVVWLSKASFCIYLVHHFFVMLLRTYLYSAYKYLCILVIPAQAAVVFGLSIVCYLILRKIPWVKDHLI